MRIFQSTNCVNFDIDQTASRLFKVVFQILLLFFWSISSGQNLDDFNHSPTDGSTIDNAIMTPYQFNGYTNYWHDTYQKLYRYGNLFKMASPDIEKTILQSKVDIAEDMGVPGLIMQEGFINGLINESYSILEQPELSALNSKIASENILVFTNPDSELGKWTMDHLGEDPFWFEEIGSHQYNAAEIKKIWAFYLNNGDRKVFVVSSSDKMALEKMRNLISGTLEVFGQYDMYKGWFGAETLLKSVTCTDGHPLELIGTGMNEGNSWFVFNGYMDFLAKSELENWMSEVQLPVVTDVGFLPIFGCKDYDGLQVQSMFTKESWIDYAHNKGGYVFRQVWDTLADPLHYDGYLAEEGNKEQIDNEDVPFVLSSGKLDDNMLSSMVLFIDKGNPLNRDNMWEAILSRREVGVLEHGKMMGPALYRNTLQMLLLDRIMLEEYFGDHIQLSASITDYNLQITIRNTSVVPISGNIDLSLPESLQIQDKLSNTLNLPGRSEKSLQIKLNPTMAAMGKTNPVAVHFSWGEKKKSTLTMLDLPPTISVPRLLYAHAPKVSYSVTVHNFTSKSSFPVNVKVLDIEDGNKVIFKSKQNCEVKQADFKDLHFDLDVPAGKYLVSVSALGDDYTSQLGVGESEGKPYVYKVDLNSDGVDEYRMENDSVQITLLATGARVIEYIVKSRNDNVLFKLWPEKAIDDKRSFRKKGYYPYGGFEDFLGQGSMETHQVYNAEIETEERGLVRVRMWTDYFGNRLQKTFTLYGNSPILEVRYALTFRNPEANVLGPQPILVLGQKHWTEDVYTIPELDGLHEYRMKPEKYYGRLFFLKEGWNAGYDTKEDVTFIGAFPVDQPLFLHMWMNHPRNPDAHHYYAEFQPWTPIYQKSTMYFTYFLYGSGGKWENGLDYLRSKNLITIMKD